MAGPDFSQKTIELLMFRAALICSRPDCGSLTVGPVDAVANLKNKKGEAAHISAKYSGQARYDSTMSDDDRADIANGIWLCASCHTMIDKDKTAQEFPRQEVENWKKNHEKLIRQLYLSNVSPLPLLRKMTEDGKIAQDAIDCVEDHGAFVAAMANEFGPHVVDSIKAFRTKMEKLRKIVALDKDLKKLIGEIAAKAQDVMNQTSAAPHTWPAELMHFRLRVAKLYSQLIQGWNCTPGPNCQQLINDSKQGPGFLSGTFIQP
jgi:hypothetical protein